MLEFLNSYREQVLLVASFLTLPVLSFIVSLGVVYLLGRMWEIVKTNRAKNIVAFVVMVGVYLFYFSLIDLSLSVVERVWYGIIYISVSIVIYVLFGFKLYDRIDSLQDKRFGRDKKERAPKARRKV